MPRGEILYSSFILIEDIFLNFGGLRLVRRIGTKAVDNNKETKMTVSYTHLTLPTILLV